MYAFHLHWSGFRFPYVVLPFCPFALCQALVVSLGSQGPAFSLPGTSP